MDSRSRKVLILIILTIVPLSIIWGGISFSTNGMSQSNTEKSTSVLYLVGNAEYFAEYKDQPIKGLSLDKQNVNLTVANSSLNINFSTQIDYDVIILNDFNLTKPEIADLHEWLSIDGHGLIIIMGPTLTKGNQLFSQLGILPGVTEFQENDFKLDVYDNVLNSVPAICVANESVDSPLLKSVAWNSAPEIQNYTQIEGINEVQGNKDIVYMTYYNGSSSKNSLVLSRALCPSYDNVIVFTGWYSEGINVEFQLWPYFNYVMFNAVQSSAEQPVIAYKNWNFSPVPHLTDQIVLGMFVLGAFISSILLYLRARKKGESKRKKFEMIEKIEEEIAKKDVGTEDYVLRKKDLQDMESGISENLESSGQSVITENLESSGENVITENLESSIESAIIVKRISEEDLVDKSNHWEEVGFHRQQAGFLQTFFALIFLIVPQLIITSFVFPTWIQPHPQATGYYSFTLRFFEAIWLIFDLGTSYAFVKYFASNRIEHPEKAFHYAQIFIWWEILSGVVQIFVFSFLGAFIFPATSLSYLSWMFIAHSVIQFPGIFQVFQFFFQGMQRSDKDMITFVLQGFLLRLVAQVALVPLFRVIYANQIMYGDAFGAGLGLVVGQYVGDIVMFLITIKWYKNMKLKFAPIFAAEFTWKEFKESITFGAKMAIGEVWVPAVWLLQVLLVSIYIPSYAAEQGYFELAWTISMIPQAATLIFNGVLGGLTEAHTYKKHNLLNYTTSASMRLGMFWTVFLCAALWAIGPSFIIGTAGQNWRRAADLLPLLVLFNLEGPFSWQADKEFAAANKPGYAGISWILEQSTRAILLIVLLPVLSIMETVIYCYIISLAIKDIFVWILLEKKIHKHTWYPWSTFVAPGLSGLVTYIILKIIVIVIPPGLISVLIIFMTTFFLVLFIYSFLNGLFGGYDNNTIREFEKSAKMVTALGGLARVLYKSAKLGTKVSPFHNKFPVRVYEQAYKEADELTSIKKKLV